MQTIHNLKIARVKAKDISRQRLSKFTLQRLKNILQQKETEHKISEILESIVSKEISNCIGKLKEVLIK